MDSDLDIALEAAAQAETLTREQERLLLSGGYCWRTAWGKLALSRKGYLHLQSMRARHTG